MKSKYAKLFIDANNKLISRTYSLENDDYYRLVKENFQNGYKQVIITSKMMTSILKDYFLNRNFIVGQIEFMVDDSSLNHEINKLLENIRRDRAYFGDLINKIDFLSDESAIDIKKIELTGKSCDNRSMKILVQVNGIYGITDKCFEEESQIFIEMIERCLS